MTLSSSDDEARVSRLVIPVDFDECNEPNEKWSNKVRRYSASTSSLSSVNLIFGESFADKPAKDDETNAASTASSTHGSRYDPDFGSRYDPSFLSDVIRYSDLTLDDSDDVSEIIDQSQHPDNDDDFLPPEDGIPKRKKGSHVQKMVIDDDLNHSSRNDPPLPFFTCKQTLALVATVSFIALSLGMMGVFVMGGISDNDATTPDFVEPISSSENVVQASMNTKKLPYAISTYYTEEELFQLAERVIEACSEEALNIDISRCQHLCKNEMCCFDSESEYNCSRDREKSCLAHAGCDALIENIYSSP